MDETMLLNEALEDDWHCVAEYLSVGDSLGVTKQEATASLSNLLAAIDDRRARIAQSKADAERIAELCKAVGLATTMAPKVVMDSDNPLAMMQEVEAAVAERLAALEAERARLRALLERVQDESLCAGHTYDCPDPSCSLCALDGDILDALETQ